MQGWLQLQKKRCWHRSALAMMWQMRGEHGVFIASGGCESNRIDSFLLMKRRQQQR
jgi:hypothetical protein